MLKLLGIPCDTNSSFLKGAALAPSRIRQADTDGSANRFCESGIEIVKGKNYVDLNDIYFPDSNPEKSHGIIKDIIGKQLKTKDKIISFGGDHSISYPIIEAYSKVYRNLHILQFDAHTDIYERFDDNPYSHASPFARIMENNLVKSLTQVGIRSLTSHHKKQIEKYAVKLIEAKDYSIDFIKSLQSPLYISIDMDVFDPAFAPGVSHYEPGGLSSRDVITAVQSLKANIVGADIAEYNPIRDINGMTAMLAYKLFKELAAKMID